MIRPTGNLESVKSEKNSPRKSNLAEDNPTETQSSNVLRYVRRPRPNSASTQRRSGLEYSYNVHQGTLGRRFSLIPSFPDTEWELQSCLQCAEQTDTADQKHDGMSGSAAIAIPVEVCGGAAQKQDGEGVCQTQHPEALWLCSADLTENRSHLERHCWKRHWRCIVKLMEKPVSFGRHCVCVLRTPRKTDLI